MTCIKFFTGQIGSPPFTYREMHARLPWLQQARAHFKSAIERGNWMEQSATASISGWQLVGSTGPPAQSQSQDQSRFGASMSYSSQFQPRTSIYDMHHDNDASLLDSSGGTTQQVQSRKTMQPSDITMHMNTIKLQIEAIEFLHGLESSTSSSASAAAAAPPAGRGSRQPPLPTLFNRSSAREELAVQVSHCHCSIERLHFPLPLLSTLLDVLSSIIYLLSR